MPLGYRQVKDLYDTLADAGVVTKSLPEWSQEMNESLGTDLYSAGPGRQLDQAHERWRGSLAGGDRAAAGGRGIREECRRDRGQSRGRSGDWRRFAEDGRQYASDAPSGAWLGRRGRDGRLLSGAEAYTATGSETAGVLGGLTAAVMPGAANFAEQAALKAAGGRLVQGALPAGEAIRRYFPETIPQGILSQAAGQLAAGGLGVGAEIGQQVAAGQPISVSPTEQLLNLTLGQAPFAAAYLTKGGRIPWGGAATRAHVSELENAIELTRGLKDYQENKAEISNKASQENIADPLPPPAVADNVNAEINDIRIATRGLEEEGSMLGQERQEKLADEEGVLVKTQGAQPGNIFGAQIMPDTARTEVTGTVVRGNAGVADDQGRRRSAQRRAGGQADRLCTKDEPGVRPGELPETQVFGVPQGHWSEYHNKELSSAAGDLVPTGEFDAGRALTEADQELAAAKSGADVQSAVVKLNGVRAHYGEASNR